MGVQPRARNGGDGGAQEQDRGYLANLPAIRASRKMVAASDPPALPNETGCCPGSEWVAAGTWPLIRLGFPLAFGIPFAFI